MTGRALVDTTERPVAGAVIAIDKLNIKAMTDSSGRYILAGIRAGAYMVTVRKVGFNPINAVMSFSDSATVDVDFTMNLVAGQTLPDVKVVEKAVVRGKLAEFDERKNAAAGGHFLTSADIEKHSLTQLPDVLKMIPGIEFAPGPAGATFAVAGRMAVPGGSLASVPSGKANTGMKWTPCLAAVILDGAVMYGYGSQNEPKFDLNSIDPQNVAGIEYYAGPATIPVKYNATKSSCGLLIIWTK